MKYTKGNCALNGEQVWVKGAKGELVRPRSTLREGYIRFMNPETRVKVPLCNGCEKAVVADPKGTLSKIMNNLFLSNEMPQFKDKTPDGYDEFENYWASQGKTVVGIWRQAYPGE